MLRAKFYPHESHSHLPSKQARSGDFKQPDVIFFLLLGPPITNFDPKSIIVKWLEAPFIKKNGRGRWLE
jgi:hypothetical protein